MSNIELASARDELEKARIGLQATQSDAGLQGQGAALDARNKRLLADRQQAVVAELQRPVAALTLRAPFDGQVGKVQIAQGTNVAINAPILSVVDLSEFEVEIRVPESFARDLSIGVPAQVTSQAPRSRPRSRRSRRKWSTAKSPRACASTTASSPPGLRQNQRLSARIVLDTRKNVLMVERGPFVEQDGGRWAWGGGRPQRQPPADPDRHQQPGLRGNRLRLEGRRPHRRLRQRPVRRRRARGDQLIRPITALPHSLSRTTVPKTRRNSAMLEMRQVSKIYRTAMVETHALRSLDLHVREGEFVAVTGPSGSGKTTFLNIAGLLETFSEGDYLLDGENVRGMSDDARSRLRNHKIGFIFQAST